MVFKIPIPFEALKMNNADFVLWAYRILLQREPDEAGQRDWCDQLNGGLLHHALVKGFLNSNEYSGKFDRIIETSVSTGGVSFKIGSREDDHAVGRSIQLGEAHESWVTRHFLAAIEPTSTVVDIGANLGWYTMLAAAKTLHQGRVVAYEPLPDNVQLLLANARLNDFKHVVCYPVALGEQNEVLRIENGNGSNAAIVHDPGNFGRFCQVVAAGEALRNIGHFDVLKIDIEGYEPVVFRSAGEVLRQLRPTMFVEYHPWVIDRRGLSIEEFHEQLFSFHMTIRVMHPDGSTTHVRNSAELAAEHVRVNSEAKVDGRIHLDILLTP